MHDLDDVAASPLAESGAREAGVTSLALTRARAEGASAPLPVSIGGSALPVSMRGVIGVSRSLVDVYRLVDRVAPTSCTVLVTGESGTGKELVARAVHETSPRAAKPFVAVNCGAIPEALLESELFGHVRGAFTGAHATKLGRLALAQGGTIFLDEVGELPLSLQVKLLRVLQAHEYSPVGDARTHKADVRIVAATNVDLERACAEGKFREDLLYRLNVLHIALPALRERRDDIPLLMEHFVRLACERMRRELLGVSPEALDVAMMYDWPGNVRELENSLERAVLLCAGSEIVPADLPSRILGRAVERRPSAAQDLPSAGTDLRAAVEAFENNLIRQALERTGWNKNQAARLLGLNRTTLVEMLKRKRLGTGTTG